MGPTAAAAAAAYAVAMGGASSAQEQGAAAVTVDYTPGPEKLALVVTPTGTNSSRGGDECRVDGELFLQSRSQLVVTLVPTEPNPLPPPLALASADAATATAAAAAAAADAATAAAAAADAAGAAVAAAQAQAAAAQAAQAASDATAAAQAAQAAPPPARCRLRLVLVDDQDPPNVLQPLWRVLEPSDVQAMPGADGTTRFPPIRIITTPYSESVKFLRLAVVPAADATSSGSLACVALSEKLRVVGKLSRSLTKAKFSDEHKVSAAEDAHAAAAHAASRAAAAAAAAAQRGPPPAYTQAGSVRQHYEVQPGGPVHQRPVIGGGLPYYASVALEVEQRAANGGAAAAPAPPTAGAAVPLGANTIGISLGGGWATACADDATTAHALVHAPPGALLGAAAQRGRRPRSSAPRRPTERRSRAWRRRRTPSRGARTEPARRTRMRSPRRQGRRRRRSSPRPMPPPSPAPTPPSPPPPSRRRGIRSMPPPSPAPTPPSRPPRRRRRRPSGARPTSAPRRFRGNTTQGA